MSDTFNSYSTLESKSILTFSKTPVPVGWWVMPGSTGSWKTKFGAYKKPNALVRFSMKYVFGWTWEEANV